MEQLLTNVFKVKRYLNPDIKIMGILLTICDGTVLTGDVQRIIREAYGDSIHIFDVRIPKTVRIKEAAANGKTIFEYRQSKVLGEAVEAYMQLGEEVEAYA